MGYVTWKDHATTLFQYRVAGNYPAYAAHANSVMIEPTTRITPWTVWRADDAGQPYAGMQQTALGKELILGGQTWGNGDYISLGQRMLEVCKLRKRNGGLRANEGAWVYSRTGESHAGGDGLTFNQEILLARDMIEAGRLINRTDYVEIGVEAIGQLSREDRFPNAWTFVLGGKAAPKKKSWLYYDWENGGGTFISEKTGGYSILVLRTIRMIALLYAGADVISLKPWTKFCADSYRAKGNIHSDDVPASGGNWKGCESNIVPLNAVELAWLDNPS